MNSKLKDQGGYSLIELMLVIVIIGIMSTIAIPNMISYMSKTKQAEAKAALGGILVNEQAYDAEFDAYSDSFADIGFGLVGGSKYYDYTITAPVGSSWPADSWIGAHGNPGDGPPTGTDLNFNTPPGASASTFTCIAAGNIDKDPVYDIWSVNEKGELNNDYDDVIH